MKRVLITGYEPFGGDDYNPSLEIAKELNGQTYEEYTYVYKPIPVNRFQCIEELHAAIAEFEPQIVICVGLAWNRQGISVERVAINVADFPIPDNAGYQAMNETIVEGGPNAYFSELPIKSIVGALREAGIPSQISNTAGTYCCNILMYTLLDAIHKGCSVKKGGFLHIPFETKQAAQKVEQVPFMGIQTMIEAVRIAAEVSIDTERDEMTIDSGEVS